MSPPTTVLQSQGWSQGGVTGGTRGGARNGARGRARGGARGEVRVETGVETGVEPGVGSGQGQGWVRAEPGVGSGQSQGWGQGGARVEPVVKPGQIQRKSRQVWNDATSLFRGKSLSVDVVQAINVGILWRNSEIAANHRAAFGNRFCVAPAPESILPGPYPSWRILVTCLGGGEQIRTRVYTRHAAPDGSALRVHGPASFSHQIHVKRFSHQLATASMFLTS